MIKIRFKHVYVFIYTILFIFSFTYYGNHGLGDEANLPLGHFQTMESGDGYAYFTRAGSSDQISVDSFLVAHDKLCVASQKGYWVYDLTTDDLKIFSNKEAYERYAINKVLPRTDQFKTFWPQYNHYWNGWRLWLLP